MQEMSCRWRLPEFVGLGVVLVTILLVVESMPEYQQIVPPVRALTCYSSIPSCVVLEYYSSMPSCVYMYK